MFGAVALELVVAGAGLGPAATGLAAVAGLGTAATGLAAVAEVGTAATGLVVVAAVGATATGLAVAEAPVAGVEGARFVGVLEPEVDAPQPAISRAKAATTARMPRVRCRDFIKRAPLERMGEAQTMDAVRMPWPAGTTAATRCS